MVWRKPGISVVLRTLFGLPLAGVLGVVGMAIASAMAVFFGVSGLNTLLALLIIGAGTGAGIGAGAMMLRIDAIPHWTIWLAVALVLSVLGAGGGWAGFQVGDWISEIEDARCVGVCGYFLRPRTYIVLGAALVPNCIALLFNIGYEGGFGRWASSKPRVVGPAGEAQRR